MAWETANTDILNSIKMAATSHTIKHIMKIYRNPFTGGPRVSGITNQNGETDDELAEQMKFNVIRLLHEFSCLHDTNLKIPTTNVNVKML